MLPLRSPAPPPIAITFSTTRSPCGSSNIAISGINMRVAAGPHFSDTF